uniref:Putative extracellular protein TR9_083 n=1 Tax=Trebouxia lynnae TaxID=1825957 RepID=A0A7L9QEL8_9CHLO|nr:putative extracellular protein TR9_083 [Trebouxia lynnae]
MRTAVFIVCCALWICHVHGRATSGDTSLRSRSLLTDVAAGESCSKSDTCASGTTCTGASDDGSASGTCTSTATATPAATPAATSTSGKVQYYSNETYVPAVTSVATLGGYLTVDAFGDDDRQRFIETLQTNIRAKINAIVDISIDQVVVGSVLVSNTATFTDANSEAATAGQNALTAVYKSGDVAEIFGTSFGNVSVSNVQATEAKNPNLDSGAGSIVFAWPLGAALVVAIMSIAM